ncbi:MAG TPA: thioredoxin family protein [Niastella sp.]
MKPIHITVIVIITVFIFVINACTQKMANQPARHVNREATDKRGNLILLGKSTRKRLAQPPFNDWFNKNYAGYSIDSNTANQIKPLLKNKQFFLFMGTWCGDSRREVPRMYKILDYCQVKLSRIELINLNNSDTAYKQSPGHEERGLNILRVPTLLIYENGHEVGRVVESPVASLEKDMLAIVTGQPYEHRYKNATTTKSVNVADTTRVQQPARQ